MTKTTACPSDARGNRGDTPAPRGGTGDVGPACVVCGWAGQRHPGVFLVEACSCDDTAVLDAMITRGLFMPPPEEGV